MTDGAANENSTLWIKADPNTEYVADYLQKTLAHFRDCKIPPILVAMGLTDAFIKLLPGKPYDKLPDEAELVQGLSLLTPSISDLESRRNAYYRAQKRLHHHKLEQLMERHGCTLEEADRLWLAAQDDQTLLKTGLPKTGV